MTVFSRFIGGVLFVFMLWGGGCGDDSGNQNDANDASDTTDTAGVETDGTGQDSATTDTSTPLDTGIDIPSDLSTDYTDVEIQSRITRVQPMTGIVLWNDHEQNDASQISLEYTYMGYDEVVITETPTAWNWQPVEALLDDVASHDHQAVLRFYFVYPGYETTVPAYIKESADYNETVGTTEGAQTWFADWSSETLQQFVLTFYSEFAARYDDDPRLAFLQVGFGLWAEYHIYEPGEELGVNFPSKAFQKTFFSHLSSAFTNLYWSVSIDAADNSNTPLSNNPDMMSLPFDLFDDSFLHEEHGDYNRDCFLFFGEEKRFNAPVGGELSYYSDYDQQHALDADGPYGVSFEELAATYNVTYMIGNDQPGYQSMARIEEAGMSTGYRFALTSLRCSADHCIATITNRGIAPIYYDAYPSIDGVRSEMSLKGLRPGQSNDYLILQGGPTPILAIECERLVGNQQIEFESP